MGVPNIIYDYGFCLQFTKYGIVFIWQWWWQINSGKMLCFQRRNKETVLSNFAQCCNLVSLVPMFSSISNVSNILKIVILESIGINGNIFLHSANSPNTIEKRSRFFQFFAGSRQNITRFLKLSQKTIGPSFFVWGRMGR